MIECVLRNGQIRKSQWEFFFFLEKEMFAVVVTWLVSFPHQQIWIIVIGTQKHIINPI